MKRDSTQTTLGSLESEEITSLRDIDWTFEGADIQQFTHGLHNYPARMVPPVRESPPLVLQVGGRHRDG